jgi:hypothetical protein
MEALDKLFAGVASAALSVSCIVPAVADVPFYAERGPAWTHTASSCAMDPQSLSKVALANADFSFQSNAFSDPLNIDVFGVVGGGGGGVTVGYEPIIARCNVLNPLDEDPTNIDPSWNALIVGYQDPDGTGLETNVTAKLIRVGRNNGTVSTVATFDSNKSNDKTRTEELVFLTQPIDFRHHEYYVQLELLRTPFATHQIPAVYSVRLVNVSFCCN